MAGGAAFRHASRGGPPWVWPETGDRSARTEIKTVVAIGLFKIIPALVSHGYVGLLSQTSRRCPLPNPRVQTYFFEKR